jgi:hypothetical protein
MQVSMRDPYLRAHKTGQNWAKMVVRGPMTDCRVDLQPDARTSEDERTGENATRQGAGVAVKRLPTQFGAGRRDDWGGFLISGRNDPKALEIRSMESASV